MTVEQMLSDPAVVQELLAAGRRNDAVQAEIRTWVRCGRCGKEWSKRLFTACPHCKIKELRAAIIEDTLRMVKV